MAAASDDRPALPPTGLELEPQPPPQPLLRLACLPSGVFELGLRMATCRGIAAARIAWASEGDLAFLASRLGKYRAADASAFTGSIRYARDWQQMCRATRDTRAWICLSSHTAIDAQDWCRKQMIAVPEELSIVALQSEPALIRRGISAAVPDTETIGYQHAHCLIGDIPLARTRHGYLQTRAVLFHRSTMAL